MGRKGAWALLGLVPALLIGGCMVEKHSSGSGKDDDVSIHTPLGGLDVKHDANADSVGLPVYPGATLIKDGNDSGAANVRMGFGDFQLRVVALKYRTGDAAAKVEAFYRAPMSHYGTVLTCHDGEPVGQPTHTPEGLDCAQKGHGQLDSFHFGDDHDLELRTGSTHHQRVVSIKSSGTGTELTLVRVDLPRGLGGSQQSE